MIFLTPPTGSPAVHAAIRDGRLGMLTTPMQGNVMIEGAVWAADNGCFGKGYPGDDAWLDWLARKAPDARHLCLFATAPDVVGDFAATERRCRPLLERVRALDYPVALVAQDGMEWSTWDCWDEIDALFIGGSTGWKLGAEAANIAAVASSMGKHVHMGRVNSNKRMRLAAAIGCDSADGTILSRGPDRWLSMVLSWPLIANHPTLEQGTR